MRFALQVDIRIRADQVTAFMAKLAENAAAARAEPGCLQFDILVDPQDATRVMLYEVYADEAAFQAHQQTAAFKRYLAQAVPLLESRQRHAWQRIE
jgi:quinol monooxygenase YgiN